MADTNISTHGPYEDAIIAGLTVIGKVIDGQPPEVKKLLWEMYVEDIKAWRDFWKSLTGIGISIGK